jgi:hypothetical protein
MSSQDKGRGAGAPEMPVQIGRDERERLLQLAFAEVLLLRMRDATLSRTLVARTAGISRSYLQSLLAAKKQPSLVVVWALAQAVELDPEDFIRRMKKCLARLKRFQPSSGQDEC